MVTSGTSLAALQLIQSKFGYEINLWNFKQFSFMTSWGSIKIENTLTGISKIYTEQESKKFAPKSLNTMDQFIAVLQANGASSPQLHLYHGQG